MTGIPTAAFTPLLKDVTALDVLMICSYICDDDEGDQNWTGMFLPMSLSTENVGLCMCQNTAG